ncbi:MAG: hypothetical protein AB7V04_10120 [Desulfomonilaceae bacterium]
MTETPAKNSCALIGIKKTDRVGKHSFEPDGAPDTVFTLDLAPRPSGFIDEIQIKSTSPNGFWSTKGKQANANFLGLALAKNPGEILNQKLTSLNLASTQDRSYLLFASDDGSFGSKERKYTIKVLFSDGASWSGPVKVDPAALADSPQLSAGAFPVRISAQLKGISNYDAVGESKNIRGDDKADGLFNVVLETKNREITGIQIRNIDGKTAAWDTIPGSENNPIGVAYSAEPARLINNRDGSVRIPVKDKVELNFYVADNGSIAEQKTNYRVAVTFEDGEISWCQVESAGSQFSKKPDLDEPAAKAPAPSSKVSFLGTWLGFVSTDAVGQYSEMKPDSKADAVFGLDIDVHPKNVITGIEINNISGPPKKWGTGGTTPGAWGLGIAYQTVPTALLNKTDGSVRIPIEGRVQFYLYAADPGDLTESNQHLRIIVHLADGASYQQFVHKSPSTTSTVIPETDSSNRAKGIITCEFRGFIADLVNTSTKPGKDGYLDGTFITKLQVDDKKIRKIELLGPDGSARWSTDPTPPVMFLGIALYPKIYQLVDTKAGPLNVPIVGRKTIYLYAADNGLLSDPKTRLSIKISFTDNTTISTDVIK